MNQKKSGFTLIEVLVVVAILALLMIALVFSMRGQRAKAEDAKVKSELSRLKIAFEDYYNDHNCYPPIEWFDGPEDCNSGNLKPYYNLDVCDNKTGTPYRLQKDSTGCKWYKLYGTISSISDPELGEYYDQNNDLLGTYVVNSSNAPEGSDSGSGGGGGNPNNNYYWCSAINNCTSYDHNAFSCSPSYTNDPQCGGGCTSAGSCTAK